jgi:hypothetical protein
MTRGGVTLESSPLELTATTDPSPTVRPGPAITILFPDGETFLSNCLTTLPRAIAVRVAPPEAHGVVHVPPTALTATDLADCSHPVWELLIRLSDSGQIIEFHTAPRLVLQGAGESSLPALVPPVPSRDRNWLQSRLLDVGTLPRSTSTSRTSELIAVRAGLLQIHDWLDESHRLAQENEGSGRHRNGDFWHAIMHRREPDYNNSAYWFRRVGAHPVFPHLAREAERILSACVDPEAAAWRTRLGVPHSWNPLAFVELCRQQSQDERSPLGVAARHIQWQEILLLLKQSCVDAGL